MKTAIAPIAALLLSVALVLMGNGLQGTLLPIRANLEQFSLTNIGFLGTAYFIGFGLGCLYGGRIVRRVGHIRSFSAMASLASAVALVHALLLTPVLWWIFRGLTGLCFAVLYVVIESWLNERASNQNRGVILAVYNTINLTVITLGQLMIFLAPPGEFTLFALASILVSLAVIPLALTASSPPAPVEIVHLRLKYLYKVSPVACMGCLAVGLANGAFWAVGPVFGVDRGLDAGQIAAFMSAVVIGGAIGQWPLGRLSDEIDRRVVIVGAAILGVCAGILLANSSGISTLTLFIAAALFGAAAFPIYAISIAHLNDYVEPSGFVEASSGMLLLFAIGAAAGAFLGAATMDIFGPASMFAYTAAMHGALALFATVRIRFHSAPAAEEKQAFQNTPRTSPTYASLDTRGESD